MGGGKKRVKRAEKSRKARFSLRKEHVLMSSDEDEPAPSPSATVLARRASREVKPLREESSSDEDAEEPEQWEGADETSCSEEKGEEVERVSNAQRGRVRLARCRAVISRPGGRRRPPQESGREGLGAPSGDGALCGAEWRSCIK